MRFVERRREERIQTDQPAKISVLGTAITDVEAQILDFSGRGLRLLADHPVAFGAAVKIEAEDELLLGEVRYCQPANGNYELGLELQHSLHGLKELTRLNQRLLGLPAPGSLKDEITAGRR